MKKYSRITSDERAFSIILKPLMTEKSTNLNQFNQYSFVVAKSSNSNEIKLADVLKVDEGSYIEQFLPKVLADRCTVMVVDKKGDTKGYITEKELAISLSKDGYNLK